MVFRILWNPVVCQATFLNGKLLLEQAHQYKYLGTIIIYMLNDKQDIVRSRDSFIRRNGKFYKNFHSVDQSLKSK